MVKERIWGLDCIRIMLAFLIFLFHSRIHLNCDYGIFNNFIENGSIAMTGFFMLSGYCLALSNRFLDFNFENIKKFYIKRFISVWPIYIISGTLYVIMNIIAGQQSLLDNIILLPIELLSIQAFFPDSLFSLAHNGGTWFVSCIMICYAIYPLLVRLNSGNNKNIVFAIFISIYLPFVVISFDKGNFYTNPFFRISEFMIGISLANRHLSSSRITYSKKYNNFYSCLIWAVILLMGVLVSFYNELKIDRIPIQFITIPCFSLIIYYLGIVNVHSIFKNRYILYLSNISYSFFLAQFFVWNPTKFIVKYVCALPNDILILLTFISVFVISMLLNKFIEKPCKKYLTSKLQ